MNNISLRNNNIELNDILETINSLPSSGKEEQEKSVNITENGEIEVVPDIGKVLSKVNIVTNVEGVGGDVAEERLKWINRSWTEFNSNEPLIGGGVFAFCSSLTSVNLPNCGYVGSSAFLYCTSLTSVNLPMCNTIEGYTFSSCPSLISVNLPVCSRVGDNAFYRCTSLTSIDLPMCNAIEGYTFAYCSSLESVNLPVCNSINGYGAFAHCSSLTSIDLPMCNTIGYSTFVDCKSLTSVNLPNCGYVGSSAFIYCYSLPSIDLPACNLINANAFAYCSSLSSVNLPVCSIVNEYVFRSCHSLTSLTLGYSGIAKLSNTNAFQSTPMSVSTLTGSFGSIYVPASLVDAYKSATNWTVYADRITAIVEILPIDNITIALNSIKHYEVQLAGFTSTPENINIATDNENSLSISNIQANNSNVTFDIITDNTICEVNATITLSDGSKIYNQSFKISVVSSPIGDIEAVIGCGKTQTISIPCYGDEVMSNILITSSDDSKLSISNINATTDNITFDATAYDNEAEIDIMVSATYKGDTYTATGKIWLELIPSYTVEELDTTYTFVLNSNGYYESNNKGESNTYAICKVNINAPKECVMYVDCINFAEHNWDYGILSELDTTLGLNNKADTSYKHSFKTNSTSQIQTITYDVPTGEHFIYVKYIKDNSGDQNNDSLQFAIRFE